MVAPDSTTTHLTTDSAGQAYGDEQATTFTVTVNTGNGEPLPVSQNVTVQVGSTSCLATLTPDSHRGPGGCAIGSTDLDVGPYTASASYGGDTDLSGSGPATTPFTVTQDSTTTALTTNVASRGLRQRAGRPPSPSPSPPATASPCRRPRR